MKRGLVQVYTGNGKGKTTAAFGQTLRAVGHGWRVLIIQFMKGDPFTGEVQASSEIEGLRIIQSGPATFAKKGAPSQEELALARQGMEKAWDALRSGQWEMLVLDEINVAVDYGLVSLDEVLSLIRARQEPLHLVLTGRYANQEIIDAADLVTEMREQKHPFREGVTRLEGIDF